MTITSWCRINWTFCPEFLNKTLNIQRMTPSSLCPPLPGKRFSPHHVGSSLFSFRPHLGVFHVHGCEEEPLHQPGEPGSHGFHQDLPWHEDLLFSQPGPPGQRPRRLLCLQPTGCRLPNSRKERAGLRPGNPNPLGSRLLLFLPFTFFFVIVFLPTKLSTFVVPVRSQHIARICIQSRRRRWGWPRCCW